MIYEPTIQNNQTSAATWVSASIPGQRKCLTSVSPLSTSKFRASLCQCCLSLPSLLFVLNPHKRKWYVVSWKSSGHQVPLLLPTRLSFKPHQPWPHKPRAATPPGEHTLVTGNPKQTSQSRWKIILLPVLKVHDGNKFHNPPPNPFLGDDPIVCAPLFPQPTRLVFVFPVPFKTPHDCLHLPSTIMLTPSDQPHPYHKNGMLTKINPKSLIENLALNGHSNITRDESYHKVQPSNVWLFNVLGIISSSSS